MSGPSQVPWFTFLLQQEQIIAQLRDLLHHVKSVERSENRLMALSQAQQAAVDELTASLATLGTDLDTVLAAVTTNQQALTEQIAGLTALRDQLQAANAADEAQIGVLNDTIAALRAQQAGADTDVVGALGAITTTVKGLDQHVTGIIAP